MLIIKIIRRELVANLRKIIKIFIFINQKFENFVVIEEIFKVNKLQNSVSFIFFVSDKNFFFHWY